MEGRLSGVLDTNNSNCSVYPVLCQVNCNHHLMNSRPIYHHHQHHRVNNNVKQRQCNTTFNCSSHPVFNNNGDSTQVLQSETVDRNPVKPFLITSARQRNQIGRKRSYFKSSRIQQQKKKKVGRRMPSTTVDRLYHLITASITQHTAYRECEYNPHSFCCRPSQRQIEQPLLHQQCNFTAPIIQSIPLDRISEQACNCHCYHHNCCNCQYSYPQFNDQHQKCYGYQERHNNSYHKKSISISSSSSNSSIISNGNTLSMNGSDNSSANSVTSDDSGNRSNNSYTKSVRNKNAQINLRLVGSSSSKQSDRQNYPMKFIKQLVRNCNSDHIPIVLNVNVPKTKSNYSKMSKNPPKDTDDNDDGNNYERKKQSTKRLQQTECIKVNRLAKDSPKEMNQSKKNPQYSPTAYAKESPHCKVTKHKGKLSRLPSDTDDKDDSQSSRQKNYSKLFKNLKCKKSVNSQTKQTKPHKIHSSDAEDMLMNEKSVDEMTETSESDRIPVKLNNSKTVKPQDEYNSSKDNYIRRPTSSTGIKQSPKLDALIKSSKKDKNIDMYCKITPSKQSGMSNQLPKHILCKIKYFNKCENQTRTSRRLNCLIDEDPHDGDSKARGEYYASTDETRRSSTQQSSGSDSRDSILTCFVKAASKHVENEIDNNMLFNKFKFISDSDEQ
ncbi:unnamed protein product [Trichobilharzia szidati]|nr:unnamed protein product [Trichobilharzia szidati]